jgi:hypothetical protein
MSISKERHSKHSKRDKKDKKEKKEKKHKRSKAKLAETVEVFRRDETIPVKDIKNTTFQSGAPSSGTGSRITQVRGTKALFQKLQDQVDLCVTRAEFDKTNSDVPRLLAEVGIFKEKMKIYERSFHELGTH